MKILVAIFVLVVVVVVAINPFSRGHFVNDTETLNGDQIVDALNAYADKHGEYPHEGSSTAVFQKLLDEGFVTDPSVFYLPFKGKSPAATKHLSPENVCWDVTYCSDPNDLNLFHCLVPLVFVTGAKVSYEPGASAILSDSAVPGLDDDKLSIIQAWRHDVKIDTGGSLLSIYRNRSCVGYKVDEKRMIPNFISPDFNSNGKVFQQLTPK